MAKHLLYSEVTCHLGGKTHSKGVSFQSERPKRIEDQKVVDRFRNHPWFTVLDFWHEDIEKFSAIKEEIVEEIKLEDERIEEEKGDEPENVEEKELPKKPIKKIIKKKALKKKIIKNPDEE